MRLYLLLLWVLVAEVFSPVSLGRKAIGIELKDSYYKQAILNLQEADKRFKEKVKQTTLF